MITDEAVLAGAAAIQVRLDRNIGLNDLARAVLEAAAPHMLNLAKREAWEANLELQRLRTHKHQCEPWQLAESAKGGMYCGACGEHQPDSPK